MESCQIVNILNSFVLHIDNRSTCWHCWNLHKGHFPIRMLIAVIKLLFIFIILFLQVNGLLLTPSIILGQSAVGTSATSRLWQWPSDLHLIPVDVGVKLGLNVLACEEKIITDVFFPIQTAMQTTSMWLIKDNFKLPFYEILEDLSSFVKAVSPPKRNVKRLQMRWGWL